MALALPGEYITLGEVSEAGDRLNGKAWLEGDFKLHTDNLITYVRHMGYKLLDNIQASQMEKADKVISLLENLQ